VNNGGIGFTSSISGISINYAAGVVPVEVQRWMVAEVICKMERLIQEEEEEEEVLVQQEETEARA